MAGEQSKVSDLELVRQAVEMPGQMGPQYTYFRDLSFGNQAYLYMQGAREIVGKYIDWKKVGRHVIAGSKAFEIVRPWFRKLHADDFEVVGVERPVKQVHGCLHVMMVVSVRAKAYRSASSGTRRKCRRRITPCWRKPQRGFLFTLPPQSAAGRTLEWPLWEYAGNAPS